MAIADEFHLTAGGDAVNGYTIDVTGTLATINWNFTDGFHCQTDACGDDTTVSTIVQNTFSGNTQNMALWDSDSRTQFGGTYIATNAQAHSTVLIYGSSPSPQWYLDLANPHLDINSNHASGSFTAWVPPNYFTTIGTTASDALAAGFVVTRSDGTVDSTVDASVTADNDGVLFRTTIGYSHPRITVAQVVAAPPSDAGVAPTVDAGVASDAGVSDDAGLAVTPDAQVTHADAAVTTSGADAAGGPVATSSGGGCSTSGNSTTWFAAALLLLTCSMLRKRERAAPSRKH